MSTKHTAESGTDEITILGRLLSNGQQDLTPDLARYFLGLGFTEQDKARMHELAVKNQEGTLLHGEKEELLGYAKAGCLLGILQSRARRSLKEAGKHHTS